MALSDCKIKTWQVCEKMGGSMTVIQNELENTKFTEFMAPKMQFPEVSEECDYFSVGKSFFIGPESDHCLPLSVTDSLTNSLTDCCLVNLIDVTLACEDANSKLV